LSPALWVTAIRSAAQSVHPLSAGPAAADATPRNREKRPAKPRFRSEQAVSLGCGTPGGPSALPAKQPRPLSTCCRRWRSEHPVLRDQHRRGAGRNAPNARPMTSRFRCRVTYFVGPELLGEALEVTIGNRPGQLGHHPRSPDAGGGRGHPPYRGRGRPRHLSRLSAAPDVHDRVARGGDRVQGVHVGRQPGEQGRNAACLSAGRHPRRCCSARANRPINRRPPAPRTLSPVRARR
jgi:hypothetical protein